jgi:uncharacterized membrane protein YfcA
LLALKLLLVPTFLLLVSLAAKRWGPSVAGWLAGLPLVAGPILFFLAVEHGNAFASSAAAASLSAVFASVAFSLVYSHAAQRLGWQPALFAAMVAWGCGVVALSFLPANALLSLFVAALTLFSAPHFFPKVSARPGTHSVSKSELGCRMGAGAMLTVGVTLASGAVGAGWSGLFAVFPVLTIVLAVFSHRTHGAAFVATLLGAMAKGLYSFAAFCFVLSASLVKFGAPVAFLSASLAAVLVQVLTKRHLTPRSTGRAPA